MALKVEVSTPDTHDVHITGLTTEELAMLVKIFGANNRIPRLLYEVDAHDYTAPYSAEGKRMMRLMGDIHTALQS